MFFHSVRLTTTKWCAKVAYNMKVAGKYSNFAQHCFNTCFYDDDSFSQPQCSLFCFILTTTSLEGVLDITGLSPT